ncbi:MAG: DUF1570 domain-containing protein [Planctomycetes bacterium]|nr:DUF1570 domain-containing protein [Planctomycetota bacterium]
MSALLIRCPKCRTKLNLARVQPGKAIHCPKCQNVITVPSPEPKPEPIEEAVAEPEPEPEPAPARRTAGPRTATGRGGVATRRPVTRAAAPAKGANTKVLIAVGAAIVVVGIGGFLALRSSGSKPTDATAAKTTTAPANADSAKAPATPTPVAVPSPAAKAADTAAKRRDYLERADAADSVDEHLALADWCEREGFPAERKRELERALVYNPKSKDANQKIGNVLYKASDDLVNSSVYDRDLDRFNGRWLTPEEQAAVKKIEEGLKSREKDLADAIAKDPWRKKANTIVINVKNDSALKKVKLWETIQKPYVVFVEDEDPATAKQIGEELAQNLCDLQAHFMDKFNGMLHDVDQAVAFPFILFANRKAFDDYNEQHSTFHGKKAKKLPPSLLAFYHNQSRTVISYRLSPTDRGGLTGITYSTVFHEGTHQLRAHYTKGGAENYETWTFWWNEGIAEYVSPSWDAEAARTHKHKFETVHAHRVEEFKAAMLRGKYVPLFDLLSRPDQASVEEYLFNTYKFQPNQMEELMSQYVSLFYAESWSFIYFLNNYQNAKYRDAFNKYCLAEFEGDFPHREGEPSGSRPYLQELLGIQNRAGWDQLQTEWIEYVKSL